jgi:hypothetical protein
VTDVCASFVAAAKRQLEIVGFDLGVPPDKVIEELLRAVWRHDRPRQGVMPSGVEYFVHGLGCRLVSRPDGQMIDLDVADSGETKFDLWRVKQWAKSAGVDYPGDEAIAGEAELLARRGVLREMREGWWSLGLFDTSAPG